MPNPAVRAVVPITPLVLFTFSNMRKREMTRFAIYDTTHFGSISQLKEDTDKKKERKKTHVIRK
jgi:hypothetical protein